MPYWVASSSPDAIAWSASQGHPILMDPHAPHTGIAEKYQAYCTGMEENGFNVVNLSGGIEALEFERQESTL